MKNKILFWTPRILDIILILFLALFSLDVFDSCNGFLSCVLALFIHNIPSIILLLILIACWRKHEWVIGSLFILGGFLYIGIMIRNALMNPFEIYMISYSFIIAGPAFLIGALFFINYFRSKKSDRLTKQYKRKK